MIDQGLGFFAGREGLALSFPVFVDLRAELASGSFLNDILAVVGG